MPKKPAPAPKTISQLKEALQSLNLPPLDQRLYLLLLEKGSLSVSSLSRQLKVERPTVYAAIERLQELSLIPTGKTPYSRQVTAESPKRVAALLEQQRTTLANQQRDLEKQLPDLLAAFASKNPTSIFRLFEGRGQFLTVFEEVLSEAEDEILFMGDADSFIKFEGMDYERAWIKKRVRKGLLFKMIVKKSPVTETFQQTDKADRRETHFLPADMTFTSSIMLYGQKSLLWNPVAARAIVVEDPLISTMLTQLFNHLWSY